MASPNIWEGWYECQVAGCSEKVYLLREEPGPEGWQAQVLHDHDEGAWVVAVFPHKKGQRYWAEVKRMRTAIAEQKRSTREQIAERKRLNSASSSRRSSSIMASQRETSLLHGSPSDARSTTTDTPAPASTTSSGSSTATAAESTETSSISLEDKRASGFLKRLHSSGRSSE